MNDRPEDGLVHAPRDRDGELPKETPCLTTSRVSTMTRSATGWPSYTGPPSAMIYTSGEGAAVTRPRFRSITLAGPDPGRDMWQAGVSYYACRP